MRKPAPVSLRQGQVLALFRELFGTSMEATHQNYLRIARRIGVVHGSNVLGCLYALRSKGLVRSEGTSTVRPERWIATRAQHSTE